MRVIVTGAAGFIGAALICRLLARGDEIIGLDNHNNYYDPKLKEDRLSQFADHPRYTHFRLNLIEKDSLLKIFDNFRPPCVVNLAAQAGVRYSVENPLAYVESNILGFANVLECCRQFGVRHLVYASSSSVYGANSKMPYIESNPTNHPLSVYAATKKSNELMAHVYSNLYKIPTTGVRFFTVYGPWGRPDMALFKFTQSILMGKKIKVFNYGKHKRDFTYIDDVVDGLIKIIDKPASSNPNWDSVSTDSASSFAPWRIYNIGRGSPVGLIEYINSIERALGKSAIIEFIESQEGEMAETFSSTNAMNMEFDFQAKVSIDNGVDKFVAWYKHYYNIK
jgi:UDP-glucuronate 4-epimerase